MSNPSMTIKSHSHTSLIAKRIKRCLSEAPQNNFLTNNTKLEYTDNIQNGLLAALIHRRIRQMTNIFLVLLAINVFMLFLYLEVDRDQNEGRNWLVVIYTIHVLSALMTVALNAVEYDSLDDYSKSHFSFHGKCAEIFFYLLIHPIPWINQKIIDIEYDDQNFDLRYVSIKVNHVILLVTLMTKGLIFLTNILINSRYMQPRASRIKKIYSVNVEKVIYALRCIFRDQPIKLFVTFFTFGTVFFSYSLKVIESNVPIMGNHFKFYGNCLWFMMITTTTVGYGQLRPLTQLGRVFVIAATIFGSLCISGTIFIFANALTLDHQETAGLTALKRVNSNLLYIDNCKIYLRMTLSRLWRNYKYKERVNQSFEQRKLRNKLQQIRREGKMHNSTGNIIDLCQNQFDTAFHSTAILCENNVNLVNFINNHIFSEDLLREYGISYALSHQKQSNILSEYDKQNQQDSYDRHQNKKVYDNSQYVESKKIVKIQVLKQPSSLGVEPMSQKKFHRNEDDSY